MIRVLIERIVATGLEHYYDCTVKRTVSSVIQAPGCISGESLVDSDNPEPSLRDVQMGYQAGLGELVSLRSPTAGDFRNHSYA